MKENTNGSNGKVNKYVSIYEMSKLAKEQGFDISPKAIYAKLRYSNIEPDRKDSSAKGSPVYYDWDRVKYRVLKVGKRGRKAAPKLPRKTEKFEVSADLTIPKDLISQELIDNVAKNAIDKLLTIPYKELIELARQVIDNDLKEDIRIAIIDMVDKKATSRQKIMLYEKAKKASETTQ